VTDAPIGDRRAEDYRGRMGVVFITGPSGSGKSTVAERVAERWPTTCVLLDFDRLRTFIRSGYAEPAYGWTAECERQWSLARRVIAAAVPVYLAQSVDVVVDAYANPGDFDLWRAAFGSVPTRTFVLMPPLALALARNRQREGPARLIDEDVRGNYAASAGWRDADVTVVRIQDETPDELAERVFGSAAVPDAR
jgi:energy-coupling factor transporter ATP-binding protein EcfA2